MKTILLFVLAWLAICAFAVFIYKMVTTSGSGTGSAWKVHKSGSNRNYKVRFDSIKEKYYITNELPNGKDRDVVGFFGFRKYYTDKFKVELITEKLNEK